MHLLIFCGIMSTGGLVPYYRGNVALAVHHDPSPRSQQRNTGSNASSRGGEELFRQIFWYCLYTTSTFRRGLSNDTNGLFPVEQLNTNLGTKQLTFFLLVVVVVTRVFPNIPSLSPCRALAGTWANQSACRKGRSNQLLLLLQRNPLVLVVVEGEEVPRNE